MDARTDRVFADDGRSEARIRADLALPPVDDCAAAKRAAALAHALLTELVGSDILDEESISDLSPETWAEIQEAIAASAPYALYKPPTQGATAEDAMRTWREEDR